MDRLFPAVPALLSPQGRFYLLALKENLLLGTERTSARATRGLLLPRHATADAHVLRATLHTGDLTRAVPGFTARTVLERRAGRERLSVLCYERTATPS